MEKNTENTNSKCEQTNLPYKNCLNCGEELQGKFCHICGQEATSKTPTIPAFLLEYVNNAFIWDTKFFKTVWTLIRRPGHLTKEFNSGKFVSQENPLKLNMFLLFVIITMFVLFANKDNSSSSIDTLTKNEFFTPGLQIEFLLDNGYADKMNECSRDTIKLNAPLMLAENYPKIITCVETLEVSQDGATDKWIAVLPEILIDDHIVIPDTDGYYVFNPESNASKREFDILVTLWSQMVELILKYFPMIVLFTAPFLSMSLSFVQRRNRLPRINHFIFALHYTALLELLIICIFLLHLTIAPSMVLLQWIMIIASCLYLTIAFRNVYETKNWFGAIFKALFTSIIYFLICLMTVFVIFIVAVFLSVDKFV